MATNFFCECKQVYLLKSEERHVENEIMILGAGGFAPNLEHFRVEKIVLCVVGL